MRVLEILNYATYDQAEVLFDTMGFGQALDAQPLLLLPGILGYAWGGAVHAIADGARRRARRDRARCTSGCRSTATIEVAGRTVEAGTTAGLRFEVQGIAHGRPVVVLEHVTRLHDDVAPDWPEQVGQGGYHIIVDGEPRSSATSTLSASDGDHNTGGLIVTATKLLNAIPAVVAAPPGLLSVLDLPLVTGRHLVEAERIFLTSEGRRAPRAIG